MLQHEIFHAECHKKSVVSGALLWYGSPSHLLLALIGLKSAPMEAVGNDTAAGCLATATPPVEWGDMGVGACFALCPAAPKVSPA